MVKDARSRATAGLPTDHFPVEVAVCLKLRAAAKRGGAREAWDFQAATEEQKQAYDQEAARCEKDMERATNVAESWSITEDGVREAMRRHIPAKTKRPGGRG